MNWIWSLDVEKKKKNSLSFSLFLFLSLSLSRIALSHIFYYLSYNIWHILSDPYFSLWRVRHLLDDLLPQNICRELVEMLPHSYIHAFNMIDRLHEA